MNQPATTCAAAEPTFTRVLRLAGIALLVGCSAVLVAATRPMIEAVSALTYLRLGAFVATLGMLVSSVAAFWWRDASLRRVEWAAYLGVALLLTEQFATGPNGGPVHSVALIFGLLVFAVVVARIIRRPRADAAACNCG